MNPDEGATDSGPTVAASDEASVELTDALRDHLDRHGRLRSHVNSDDVSVEEDVDDAAALMAVAAGIDVLMRDLRAAEVSQRNLKHVEDRVARRAGRELMEKIWENPRRRHEGRPVLSNKFAYGGLWSPAAAQLMHDGADYKNKRILEHVVPAKTVVAILGAHALRGGDALGGAVMLAAAGHARSPHARRRRTVEARHVARERRQAHRALRRHDHAER